MKISDREILILYNPEMSSHRKTVAYAQTVSRHILSYSFQQNPFGNTIWCEILDALEVEPKELFDKSAPYYQANLRDKEFDKEGWCNVLRRNPDLIKAPIAMRGKRAILCVNPTDIYRLAKEEEKEVTT